MARMMKESIKKGDHLYVNSVKSQSFIPVTLSAMKKVILERKGTFVVRVAKHLVMQNVLKTMK